MNEKAEHPETDPKDMKIEYNIKVNFKLLGKNMGFSINAVKTTS